MRTVFTFLLSESILLPIIVGLLAIKKIKDCWLPFFCVLLMSFAAELLSYYDIEYLRASNALVINIYSLCECCLIIYQLHILNSRQSPVIFYSLIIVCNVFWLTENIAFKNIDNFSPYFRVLYAFLIVLLSINLINRCMVDQRNSLVKNPVFLLCLSFIIFFIYQIIYEASFFIGSDKSVVANKIIVLFAYVNAATNVMYACTIWLIYRYNYVACSNKKNNFQIY
jgi:hypothetical protein